ncbi:MAG TPA: diaminopimelate epimerase [Abditibacteriaceae bacterium]|nr:diaminopimelate epimerase [Abditibacteriaceae bacterium]
MESLAFVKMHGLGNDFVMLDCLQTPPPPAESLSALSQAACNRHFGVGGDGLILILPDEDADYRMRMFNPDGSESEMCGNGIRCFGKYLYDAGLIEAKAISVATMQGLQQIEIQNGAARGSDTLMVRVDMGTPRLLRSQIPMRPRQGNGDGGQVINEPLQAGGATYNITAVSMGNPHCVIFVEDVESVALKEIGLEIEHHDAFPQRTNVHFVQVIGPQKLWMRTWERGAGDTLACGSGACAVAVAAVLTGRLQGVERRALIHLPGGDLEIEWANNNHVYMTGPATTVFAGELDKGFLQSIGEL